jgi:predicted MFS family arabinose efflux permease
MPDLLATNRRASKRFVFSLTLAIFGTSMLDVLSSLFLLDLSKTFLDSTSLTSIAIVSQIVTISAITAIVFGLLSGFLSVKVNHKYLLLFGAICIVVGTIGCLSAPNLLFLQIFYPFDGIGTIVVAAMAFTLIGETLPFEQRAKAIGIVTSAGLLSTALGFGVAGILANNGGWQVYLAYYVLPIALAAVFLVYALVPNSLPRSEFTTKSYSSSFKEIIFNKSAIACLVGNTFLAAGGVWSFFSATFWRKQFYLPVEDVALITIVVVLVYSLGSLIGGRIIDRVGRKRFVVFTWFTRGVLIMAVVLMPTALDALLASFIATFIGGFALTGGHSLTLEQTPHYKGTMMSASGVFNAIGVMMGTGLGGLALTGGFLWLGLLLGCFGVSSAFIVLLLVKEPCKGT